MTCAIVTRDAWHRPPVTTDKWGGCVTSHNVLQVLTSWLSRVLCLCLGATKTNWKSLTMLQPTVQCTCCLHTTAGPRDRCQHCHGDTWHAEMSPHCAIFSRQTAWQQPAPLIYISKLNWSDIKTLLPATFFLVAAAATFSLDIKQCDFSFMTLFNTHLNLLNHLFSLRFCCIAVNWKWKLCDTVMWCVLCST